MACALGRNSTGNAINLDEKTWNPRVSTCDLHELDLPAGARGDGRWMGPNLRNPEIFGVKVLAKLLVFVKVLAVKLRKSCNKGIKLVFRGQKG